MNILVANISTFPFSKEEKEYSVLVSECKVSTVKAYQTNESIIKALVELKPIIATGGLNKIIALVSSKALNEKNKVYDDLTSFEYYKSIVNLVSPNTQIDLVPLENENEIERPIPEILNEICSIIDLKDCVYIDSAGGKRTTSNLIQLLTKLLNYKGIKNPYTLYSDINGKQYCIIDTADFQKMTDLADAFNEFMTSGRTKQLITYFADETSDEVINLLSIMTEFSDKIQLGNIEHLDKTVKDLINCISVMQEIDPQNCKHKIGTIILKQFLPVIKEKLIGENDKVDYLKIIRWCLDNMLVQQALTIYVEKLPVYLFEHEIIKYYGDARKAHQEYFQSKNKTDPGDWETYFLYSEILDFEDNSIKELKAFLKGGVLPKNENALKIVKILNNIQKTWSKNILKISIPKEYDYLRVLISVEGYKDYTKFQNALNTHLDYLNRLLGLKLPDERGDPTTNKKFFAIKKIQEGYRPENVVFKASISDIVRIFYGYLYVKSVRNQTNHASSIEILTPEQKSILETNGLIMTEYSVYVVLKNIRSILDLIETIEKNSQIAREEENQSFIPTNLKIGDIVSASCIDKKIVHIDNYNYDIQLVIPNSIDPNSLLNKTFDVTIKQISKAGKIIQVSLN